ncbi:B12-binding domain-containing radical SAM protein [Candidatus Woesearchaeota archaeon]|nr:B12-binding domain-containing radical SAM protein [Candidatus Woesearchaeota archaeon]
MIPIDKSHKKLILCLFPLFSKTFPPIGLAYLKSQLKKDRISSICIDFNNKLYQSVSKSDLYLFNEVDDTFIESEKMDKCFSEVIKPHFKIWVESVVKIRPKYIAISIILERNEYITEHFVREIRKKIPSIEIILGGPMCLLRKEAYIERKLGDYIILGEGEIVLPQLIKTLDRRESPKSIPGLIYLGKKGIVKTDEPKFIDDLDSLSFPDFDDFDLKEYESSFVTSNQSFRVPIIFSRGCIGNCAFCNIHKFWPGFRTRTGQNVYEEVRYQMYKYNVNRFVFHDSLINGDLKELTTFCDLIFEKKIKISWSASMRIRPDMNQDLFDRMYNAGCRNVNIGLESGSENVRRDMFKPFTNKQVLDTVKMINKSGIKIHIMIIVGFPTESDEDFQDSLNFIRKISKYVNSVNFGPSCMLTEGSFIEQYPEKLGITFDNDGNWFTKYNDLPKRLERVKQANEFGKGLFDVKDRPKKRIENMERTLLRTK